MMTLAANKYTAEMAHETAALGAKWLDAHCADWAARINLEQLVLNDVNVCILGQTARCLLPPTVRSRHGISASPDYWDVVRHFAPEWQLSEWAAERGFDISEEIEPDPDDPDGETEYEMLAIAWTELIRQRLDSAQP